MIARRLAYGPDWLHEPPTARDLALDELEAATPQQHNDDAVPCRTNLGPGELCSVCWTNHTTTDEGQDR